MFQTIGLSLAFLFRKYFTSSETSQLSFICKCLNMTSFWEVSFARYRIHVWYLYFCFFCTLNIASHCLLGSSISVNVIEDPSYIILSFYSMNTMGYGADLFEFTFLDVLLGFWRYMFMFFITFWKFCPLFIHFSLPFSLSSFYDFHTYLGILDGAPYVP